MTIAMFARIILIQRPHSSSFQGQLPSSPNTRLTDVQKERAMAMTTRALQLDETSESDKLAGIWIVARHGRPPTTTHR